MAHAVLVAKRTSADRRHKAGPLRRDSRRITLCIYTVRYEWDEEKNRRNQRKHAGISFELATLVFEDERCLVYMDRSDDHTGEQKWLALGRAQPARDAAILLVVAHVYREDEICRRDYPHHLRAGSGEA